MQAELDAKDAEIAELRAALRVTLRMTQTPDRVASPPIPTGSSEATRSVAPTASTDDSTVATTIKESAVSQPRVASHLPGVVRVLPPPPATAGSDDDGDASENADSDDGDDDHSDSNERDHDDVGESATAAESHTPDSTEPSVAVVVQPRPKADVPKWLAGPASGKSNAEETTTDGVDASEVTSTPDAPAVRAGAVQVLPKPPPATGRPKPPVNTLSKPSLPAQPQIPDEPAATSVDVTRKPPPPAKPDAAPKPISPKPASAPKPAVSSTTPQVEPKPTEVSAPPATVAVAAAPPPPKPAAGVQQAQRMAAMRMAGSDDDGGDDDDDEWGEDGSDDEKPAPRKQATSSAPPKAPAPKEAVMSPSNPIIPPAPKLASAPASTVATSTRVSDAKQPASTTTSSPPPSTTPIIPPPKGAAAMSAAARRVAPGSDDENDDGDDDDWGEEASNADEGDDAEVPTIIKRETADKQPTAPTHTSHDADESEEGAPDGIPEEFWQKMTELKRQEVETALSEWLEFNPGVSYSCHASQ